MLTSKDFNLEILGAVPVKVEDETYVLVDIEGVMMFPLMSLSKLFDINYTILLQVIESDKTSHKPLRDIVRLQDAWYIAYYLNPLQVANLVKEIAMLDGTIQIPVYDALIAKLTNILQALKVIV